MNMKNYLLTLAMLLTMSMASASCGDDEPAKPDSRLTDPTETTDTTATQPGTEKEDPTGGTPDSPAATVKCFVGGDISMLSKYEEQKAAYKDRDGNAISNMLDFLKQQGWNTMRVRLFVDPSKSGDKGVCQDLDYVKKLGARIKKAGLLFMLDFHYSDTWADPGKQWTPTAWLHMDDTQMAAQIYSYTRECLNELKAAGATPDLIQTGNEISYGMLWGEENTQANRCYTNSPAANWNRFFNLLKQAGKACREVCPQAKIIIHSERVPKPDVLIDFFDRIKAVQLDYDIIGLSYYPYFHGSLNALETALSRIEQKNYGKNIQIVETGYPLRWAIGNDYDYTKVYPYTEEGQRHFTADLVALLKKHTLVNGLSWWYAEANAKGCTGNLSSGWYNASLFDNETGRALPALYEIDSSKW